MTSSLFLGTTSLVADICPGLGDAGVVSGTLVWRNFDWRPSVNWVTFYDEWEGRARGG